MAFPQRRHLGNLYQLNFYLGRFAQWMKSWRTWPPLPLKEFFRAILVKFLNFSSIVWPCKILYSWCENKQVLNWWFNFPWKICLFPKEMWHSYEINAFVFFFFFCFFGFFSQIFFLGRRVKFLSMGKWCQIPKGWAFIHFLNNSSEVGEWINDF